MLKLLFALLAIVLVAAFAVSVLVYRRAKKRVKHDRTHRDTIHIPMAGNGDPRA